MAAPPYFTTMALPWCSRMNGSASSSVRLRDGALADLRRQAGRSRRVLPVDADVLVREVAAQRAARARALPIETAMRISGSFIATRGGRGSASSSKYAAGIVPALHQRHAADRDVDRRGVDLDARGADGLQDPAGVRVAAEHGGLHERGIGDRLRDDAGVVLRGAPSTSTSMTCVTPSASAISWRRERRPDLGDGSGELLPRRRAGRDGGAARRGAAREQEHGVVRAGAPVDGERVEPRSSAARPRALQVAGATRASVVTNASIVARFGAIMPTPFAHRRRGTRPPRRSPASRPCRWS